MGYVAHPLCIQAAKEVQHYIGTMDAWQEELSHGKMFGVLVVEDTTHHQLGFLAAYSGLLGERNDWDYFVPAVFDFQQPDGYFKQEEAVISAINKTIEKKVHSEQLSAAHQALDDARQAMTQDLENWKTTMREAKKRRDHIRQSTDMDQGQAMRSQLIHESQWMKAELHRKKQHHADLISRLQAIVDKEEASIQQLRQLRHEKSDALQRWLFQHFEMLNIHGERRHLIDIFAHTASTIPPSGAGECCAPKLLQYAFAHHLRPVAMAEFWWGASPVGELREHLHFYPACRGKCLPILQYMLQDMDIEDNPFEQSLETPSEIVYEDDALLVVYKPAGLLSVPGKKCATSVWSFVRSHCDAADGPLIVHRLDMATSGLLVVAKTKDVHQHLQAQFARHTVEKTYVAQLQHALPDTCPHNGTIHLPLRADLLDRPRQCVDYTKGKEAITRYEVIGDDRVLLHPLTGRTHQLRIHCAHPAGLGVPIKGDTLYGTPADRLYLHAATLRFTHPITGERMTFTKKADF